MKKNSPDVYNYYPDGQHLPFRQQNTIHHAIPATMKTNQHHFMKHLFFLLLLAGIVLPGCKKSAPVTIPLLPAITAINPVSGPAGTTVVITGANFSTTATDNTVQFNGVSTTVSAATATSLTVTAPASGATGKITVATAGGTATGPVFTYIVVPPPPTVTAISPVSGAAGIVVTITGTNFKTTPTDNTVKFNGVAATVQTATATTLTVVAPATGTTGAVTVTTPDGTATGPAFTYIAGTDVYVVGGGSTGWGYWKNGVFTAMPANCVEARSVFANGTDVYIAGTDINTGAPAYWKNGVTIDLPMSAGHNGGRAVSVFVSGTDVYVAGWDFVNGSSSLPRCWKNGVPLTISLSSGNISAGLPVVIGVIYDVFVSGSDVYLAGSQSPFSGNQVATWWKNGTPFPLTDGTDVCEAKGIFVSGTDVYVTANDGTIPKYWKNGTPNVLNTPNNTYSGNTSGIYVSGTDVYVSGNYRNIAKSWKNGTMVDLTANTPSPTVSENATGITGIGADIYICGNNIGNGYGYWKNGAFTKLSGASIINGIFVK